MTRPWKTRDTLDVIALVVACFVIQQGPHLLGLLTKANPPFITVTPGTAEASVEAVPAGQYYLSVGRLWDHGDIYLDGIRAATSRMTIGTPIDLSGPSKPKAISIKWNASPLYPDLVDPVVLAPLGIGLLIDAWRNLTYIYLGPFSCLLLILTLIWSKRLLKESSLTIKAMPHAVLAVVGFAYLIFLAHIPNLFWHASTNTLIQTLLRVGLSAAFLYLVGSFSRHRRAMIAIHLICALSQIVVYFLKPAFFATLYNCQLVAFGFLILNAAFVLAKQSDRDNRSTLLLKMSLLWAILHVFAIPFHFSQAFGFLSIWSPTFIFMLMVADIYLIHQQLVRLILENKAARHTLQIAGQVAHDIRSPIGALKSLLRLEGTHLSKDGRELAGLAITRITEIAQDILTEYRDSRLSSSLSLVALTPILVQCINEKRIEYPDGPKISFIPIENTEQPVGLCDPRQLRRVISNLLNNAYAASKSDGLVEITLTGGPVVATIAIKDSGPGFPIAIREILLAGGRTTSKTDGLGLGLPHAIALCRAWGGDIEISRAPPQGGEVQIILSSTALDRLD